MSDLSKIVRQSEIRIGVALDAEKSPVDIRWTAQDAGLEGERPARAMMLALWDHAEKSTMRIDLWTKEMTIEEMEFFFYETLATMADTYERATGDADLTREMREFARGFGRKKGVLK